MPDAIASRLLEAFQQIGVRLLEWIPPLVVGVLLTLLAVVAAKLAEVVVRTLVKRLGLAALLRRGGLERVLEPLGIEDRIEALVPRVVYFVLLFLFAQAGADALGLTAISDALGTLLGYIPNVAGAGVVLLVGGMLAGWGGRAATNAAERAGLDRARSLGVLTTWALFFVVAVTAVGQLRIDTGTIRLVTAGLVAGGALGFGLAFGLGARELLRNILAGFYARQVFEPGKTVEFRGERGTLMSVAATQTLLEQGDRMVSISNVAMLDEVVKQDM